MADKKRRRADRSTWLRTLASEHKPRTEAGDGDLAVYIAGGGALFGFQGWCCAWRGPAQDLPNGVMVTAGDTMVALVRQGYDTWSARILDCRQPLAEPTSGMVEIWAHRLVYH
jgi:hypothetical protein